MISLSIEALVFGVQQTPRISKLLEKRNFNEVTSFVRAIDDKL